MGVRVRLTQELLRAEAASPRGRNGWFAALPDVVESIAEVWDLEVGEPYEPGGYTAWVAPVRRRGDGRRLALKVGWKHDEAEHEAEAMRRWDGNGAARLFATAEPRADTVALLLEECVPGTILRTRPGEEQDEVIASILRSTWKVPADPHPFRPLQVMCDAWADEFEQKLADGSAASTVDRLDERTWRAGIELFRSLPGTATSSVLLCTDLHAGNVLAAEREPWLLVDPKPYVGDPYYDILQHLDNESDRLVADPVGFTRRMCDLTGLHDLDRALQWVFARNVQESPGWDHAAAVATALAPIVLR